MKVFSVKAGEGVHVIEATIVFCGKDIAVTIGGGDTFHIGASALAVPRPSLADSTEISASASVICVTSHKEDEIAREAALILATKFNTRVNVTCGIHIDDAKVEDLKQLMINYNDLIIKVEKEISANI